MLWARPISSTAECCARSERERRHVRNPVSENPWRPAGERRRPAYDRGSLKAGIVHFGVGNFHRSHQAVYLDDLFNAGEGHDWALVGAGVFEGEKAGRAKLEEQDWLTTVVEQDAGHMQARVTGAMIDFLTPGDTAAIIAQLADPSIRIVSLTITEGGYFIDPASGKFNPTHPDIVADARNMAAPKTVFGLILAGLMRRRDEEDGRAVHGHVLRQHSPQWPRHVRRRRRPGAAGRRGPGRLGERACRLSERHGRPHHAGHHRPRARHPGSTNSASRTTGRCSASRSGSGCWRTISPTAARRWKRSACSSSRTSRRSN